MASSIDTTVLLANYYNKEGKQTKVSIRNYYDYLNNRDKKSISIFIYHRLYSRYLKPFEFANKSFNTQFRNGFSIMANCCLLIETLESFKNGWEDTLKLSEKAFEQFFQTDKFFSEFIAFEKDFYRNVRCGILHQGETLQGWKVTRMNRNLFNSGTKTVDALTFHSRLKKSLKQYCDDLESEDWNTVIWRRCRKKIKHIIDNCRCSPLSP